MDQAEEQSEKKIKWEAVTITALIFVAVFFVAIGVAIYFSPTMTGNVLQSKLIRKTIGVIPYPVAMVGTKFITEEKLMSNLDSVRSFYQNQDFSKLGMRVDFSTVDGKKRLEINGKGVLGKLIDDSVIQAEAQKRGINLTSDVIDQEVNRKLKEYGTGDFLKNNLEKLYGWNLDDFKENIVKPDLYRQNLGAYIQKNDTSFVAAKSGITTAQTELKNGMSFADAAKKYSEGESAQNSGELGWFSANQMLPEVAVAVFKLNIGEQSEIIQSALGYHIVKVEDKKTENNIEMVKVSQIFVKTKSFSDWLAETEKNYHILIFSREFKWNNQTQTVEFRSQVLQDYEKNEQANPSNDPSAIF